MYADRKGRMFAGEMNQHMKQRSKFPNVLYLFPDDIAAGDIRISGHSLQGFQIFPHGGVF